MIFNLLVPPFPEEWGWKEGQSTAHFWFHVFVVLWNLGEAKQRFIFTKIAKQFLSFKFLYPHLEIGSLFFIVLLHSQSLQSFFDLLQRTIVLQPQDLQHTIECRVFVKSWRLRGCLYWRDGLWLNYSTGTGTDNGLLYWYGFIVFVCWSVNGIKLDLSMKRRRWDSSVIQMWLLTLSELLNWLWEFSTWCLAWRMSYILSWHPV